MEPKLYNRLLFRLLGLPIAALLVLAIALGYSLQRVERSARAVDHSDRVIGHANRLIKLMVDEETGLRGFLLTRDPVFLQPFHEADQALDPEFAELAQLVHARPDQNARLQQIQGAHGEWQEEARLEIAAAGESPSFHPDMLRRKQKMDSLRGLLDGFLQAEESYRDSRSAVANRIDRVALLSMIVLAALAGVFIAWRTQKLFHELASTYNRQIAEVKRSGEEAYAREQWLNTTLRSIGDAVIACDGGGRIVFMNMVAEQLTGWREAEARNLPLHEVFRIFNEETRAVVESPVDKVRRAGNIVGLANHTVLIAKDDAERLIDDSGAP